MRFEAKQKFFKNCMKNFKNLTVFGKKTKKKPTNLLLPITWNVYELQFYGIRTCEGI